MGDIMIPLPNRSGWCVTWDTGKLTKRGNKQRAMFCTKDYDEALEKALDLADSGKENIEVAEAIF